jgi:branched-chain amino acid transport system permease protein
VNVLVPFFQSLIQSILLGGIYAAIGIGMSMIFGIVRLTNLAHGDLLVLSSYLSFIVVSITGVDPLLTIIVVAPAMFIIGFVIQNTMLNRVLARGAEPPLLVTFGISVIIQNLLLYFFTADARSLRTPFTLRSFEAGPLRVPYIFLLGCLMAVAIIIVLNIYLKHTYQGRAIKAASDDREVAQLMGVNIKNIYGIAMGIAMVTAAFAGVVLGMIYNFFPTVGSTYLIVAFAVVVIGGMGSSYGTLAAGMIFALAQVMGSHFFGLGFQQIAGYAVLLLMLVFRPQGIFSR